MIRVNDWIGFKDALDKDTCDKIIKIAEDKLVKVSDEEETIDRHIENHKYGWKANKNKIVSISDMIWTEEQWIYDVVWQYMMQANKEAGWKYDIRTSEYMQIARYKKGMFYDWHPDGRGDHLSVYDMPNNKLMDKNVRKLSMSVILNNDFEGGEFQFAKYDHQEPEIDNRFKDRDAPANRTDIIKNNTGTILVFPSDMWHRVKPVTKGIRYSLSIWFLGPPFL
jgi:PKHD-type hydroxylase